VAVVVAVVVVVLLLGWLRGGFPCGSGVPETGCVQRFPAGVELDFVVEGTICRTHGR
jgi:hypothetical protein